MESTDSGFFTDQVIAIVGLVVRMPRDSGN
jgi:hypothetical protein